uniref:Uncharacterized protein n=1 Tax=Anguilla anguilla TaxID=7936 RepID=A0A0E9PV28_ANGAN
MSPHIYSLVKQCHCHKLLWSYFKCIFLL